VRSLRPFIFLFLLCVLILSWILFQLHFLPASAHHQAAVLHASIATPEKITLDSHLPVQTYSANRAANNVNAKFGSRFNFVVSPGTQRVYSGSDGIYHDNSASYIVGVAPDGSHSTSIFHMGRLNPAQGDSYVQNEQWTQGLDTTRWEGDAANGLHITVDIIDTFFGEPGCTAITDCAGDVRDDTVPVFLIGVTLDNTGHTAQTGNFLFGSNRALPANNACTRLVTSAGKPVNILSYSTQADKTGGTLFLAGESAQWQCATSIPDRAGLTWHYNLAAAQSQTSYMLIGAWNTSTGLFNNTQLPAGCQQETLYSTQEWSSENAVVDFAIDNLTAGDNLLGRAQRMENILIANNTLTPEQRWVIADSLRSYKAMSWLAGRSSCAGGGYDAAVYEGSFGFLSTVDVMHEYGYFEINRVPWFFKSELAAAFNNATRNQFGVYFQHDQGGDVDSTGNCTDPGKGVPTIRATCYAKPYLPFAAPMPTEENSNMALLAAYYVFVTGDTAFLSENNNAHLNLIDAAMQHNQRVGDPATGIAYNGQDTITTYDDQNDCLHNNAPSSGNLYYQGLKEAAAYRATAYLDNLVNGDNNAQNWLDSARKIENALVREYDSHGFLPIAGNNAFNNCNGRTVTTGEGLFYLRLLGLDTTMNPTLLADLAKQYPSDFNANLLTSPAMISLESSSATGSQCQNNVCMRYEWFSKVMLSGLVADFVYSKYGCDMCMHLNVTQAVFEHEKNLPENYGDGMRENGTDWQGHYYPRGIISWAFLNIQY